MRRNRKSFRRIRHIIIPVATHTVCIGKNIRRIVIQRIRIFTRHTHNIRRSKHKAEVIKSRLHPNGFDVWRNHRRIFRFKDGVVHPITRRIKFLLGRRREFPDTRHIFFIGGSPQVHRSKRVPYAKDNFTIVLGIVITGEGTQCSHGIKSHHAILDVIIFSPTATVIAIALPIFKTEIRRAAQTRIK